MVPPSLSTAAIKSLGARGLSNNAPHAIQAVTDYAAFFVRGCPDAAACRVSVTSEAANDRDKQIIRGKG